MNIEQALQVMANELLLMRKDLISQSESLMFMTKHVKSQSDRITILENENNKFKKEFERISLKN